MSIGWNSPSQKKYINDQSVTYNDKAQGCSTRDNWDKPNHKNYNNRRTNYNNKHQNSQYKNEPYNHPKINFNRPVNDISTCEDLIKVTIDTINEYLEGYKKDDVLTNNFIQTVLTTPNIVTNTNIYDVMKFDEFQDFFGPLMNESNKFKSPIVVFRFVFLKKIQGS